MEMRKFNYMFMLEIDSGVQSGFRAIEGPQEKAECFRSIGIGTYHAGSSKEVVQVVHELCVAEKGLLLLARLLHLGRENRNECCLQHRVHQGVQGKAIARQIGGTSQQTWK